MTYRAVYVISVAAELAGMHAQTLRMYERRGLLTPSRTGGGSRRYSELDIDRLRRIHDLTNTGLNLEGVRRVLELEDEVAELRRALATAESENAEIKKQYRRELVPFQEYFTTWRPTPKG